MTEKLLIYKVLAFCDYLKLYLVGDTFCVKLVLSE